MNKNDKRMYVAPMIEIAEIAVERGFGASPETSENLDYDLKWGEDTNTDLE